MVINYRNHQKKDYININKIGLVKSNFIFVCIFDIILLQVLVYEQKKES